MDKWNIDFPTLTPEILTCTRPIVAIVHSNRTYPHPTPYTPHPIPYTRCNTDPFRPSMHEVYCSNRTHNIPYTQHPTHHTLRPTPHSLHPTPYTTHPTPHILHPTLYTPTPYTPHTTPPHPTLDATLTPSGLP